MARVLQGTILIESHSSHCQPSASRCNAIPLHHRRLCAGPFTTKSTTAAGVYSVLLCFGSYYPRQARRSGSINLYKGAAARTFDVHRISPSTIAFLFFFILTVDPVGKRVSLFFSSLLSYRYRSLYLRPRSLTAPRCRFELHSLAKNHSALILRGL